jgi:Transglutaminase-like superfamily
MAWWRSARNNWDRFLRLSRPERHLLLRALVLLPAVTLALRLLGVRRCQEAMARLAPPCRAAPPPAGRAAAAARMVLVASRHGLCRTDCLPRSLVLWWLLRRLGVPGELRIGVRKRAGQLEAHAWVEHGGRPLEDCTDEHPFVPFAGPISLPELRRA